MYVRLPDTVTPQRFVSIITESELLKIDYFCTAVVEATVWYCYLTCRSEHRSYKCYKLVESNLFNTWQYQGLL